MGKRFYQTILLISLCLAIASCQIIQSRTQNGLPHEEAVRRFLDTLNYSSLEDLSREDVFISLDFEKDRWTLNNIFSYDENGDLSNIKTRSGVCTQLCQVTCEFIKPLFQRDYDITFLAGNENIFFGSRSDIGPTHYVVKISPKGNLSKIKKVLAIDPSYKKYDYLDNFQDYQFEYELSSIYMFDDQIKDITIPVKACYPMALTKRGNYLLCLTVEKINNKYDENNFALTVRAVEKRSFIGTCLLAIMKDDGELVVFKDERYIKTILDERPARKILERTLHLFKNVSFNKRVN